MAKFPLHEAVAYDALITYFKLTGLWEYPAAASGDLEEMRFLDKVYWFYKSRYPVLRAERGSGLEAYFAAQKGPDIGLPEGFRVEGECTISAVGDLMNHPFLAGSGGALYNDVANSVFGADLAMANLECVVLPAAEGQLEIDAKAGPKLHFDPAAFEAVVGDGRRRYGFLATACNHSLDYGEQGVASTIRALRQRGIAYHGINESEGDADRATIVEAKSIRIGVVSHCFGLNAYKPPPHRPRIVNHTRLNAPPATVDFTLLESQLQHCRDARVDFVIAQLHWGMEHETYPRANQVELAHRLAEMGVDAIIGHHPHVLQPVEYYRTKRDPERVVPIYYSLGNLTNPFSNPFSCRSGVARLDLVKGTAANGSRATYVKRADLVRIDQVVDEGRKRITLRPAPR